MKLSDKYATLQGQPSGIARQMLATESHAKANKGKPRSDVHLEDAGTPAPITPEKGGDREPSANVAGRPPRVSKKKRAALQKQIDEIPAQSKAAKVKVWRLANPELYAEQKRRAADRQAKKRAEKDDG